MATGTDLVLTGDMARAFPGIADALRRAQRVMDGVRSFEDIEATFLKGAGLSPSTYRAYLSSVRSFYTFSGGLNPLQCRARHVESWYDDMVRRGLDRNSAARHVFGVKRFFKGVQAVVPIAESPFHGMSEKLIRKLSRTKKTKRAKAALTKAEVSALLGFLTGEDRATFYMLATSGLRASELCQLHWADVQFSDEAGWYCRFVQKGGDAAEQELYADAVESCRASFRERFHREPKPTDSLFHTYSAFPGDGPRPLGYHALWERFRRIGKAAREAGVLTRDVQFTPHLCRRTYCTLLARHGMDLKSVQVLSRHANIETLAKHYVDSAERASPVLARIFGGAA